MDWTHAETDPNLYEIIGCTPHSSVEQICAEYKIRALSCHPDKHPGDSDAERRFKLLLDAKSILTDPESRKGYDNWLNSGVRVSFQKWLAMNGKGHTLHWVKESVKRPMIQQEKTASEPGIQWERDDRNETLSKFRNYEI